MRGGRAAPRGLRRVCAGRQWYAARGGGRAVGFACVLKLLVDPAVLFGLSRLWGLGPLETKILILWGTMPTASSSYILARQMGGDAPLAAAIVTVCTLLAFIRSEEHTSELQSLMRISYAVFCLKKNHKISDNLYKLIIQNIQNN